MAISVAWQTVLTVGTTDTALYTLPSSGNFGGYVRDLVITNSGATTIWVGQTTSGSPVSTTTGSFQIPTGGSVILTECQVPAATVIKGLSPGTAGSASIGFATNVAFT